MWFWEAALIKTNTPGVILGSIFWYQNLEINYWILIKSARDDIALIIFRNNVTMKENKIQNFCIPFNGAWIEKNLHVSSSKNRNNAVIRPNCSKNLHKGVFQHAESKFAIRFALWLPKQYKLLLKPMYHACRNNSCVIIGCSIIQYHGCMARTLHDILPW